MSFDYIRNYYGVPAKRGARDLQGQARNRHRYQRISDSVCAHQAGWEKISKPYHPRDDDLVWLDAEAKMEGRE